MTHKQKKMLARVGAALAIFMALALAATMCAAPLGGLARADDDPHGTPAAKGSASGAPHAWFDAFSSELAASASEPSSTDSVRVILEFAPSQDGLDAQAVRDAGLEEVSKALGLAVPGDTVVLSPACSSFDEFDSFEITGRELRDEA